MGEQLGGGRPTRRGDQRHPRRRPHPSGRAVHGTKGSYTKMGLDIQEDQLKAGVAVGSETWGLDPVKGQLCLAHGDWLAQSEHNTLPGQYQAYYQGIYNAIVLGATNPVAAQDALKVIELIEAGTESARTGQKIMLNV